MSRDSAFLRGRALDSARARARQAWTIAKIELRRAFFAKRSFWVYALALLPSVIFFGHGLDAKIRSERLTRRGLTTPALMDSVRDGELVDDVKKRLGKPSEERSGVGSRRVRQRTGNAGATTHVIEPAVDARFVRLNITRPSYNGEPVARIYEFEVYGPDGPANLALNRPVTGSVPCRPDQGPEKAVNGSVAGGQTDRWCAEGFPLFLQVDLGAVRPVSRFVVKHASCGRRQRRVRHPRVQRSAEPRRKELHHGRLVFGRRVRRGADRVPHDIVYFDGRREVRLQFADGKLQGRRYQPPPRLRRGPGDLRGDLPVLLPAARDLLRLSRHLHVSLPRRR